MPSFVTAARRLGAQTVRWLIGEKRVVQHDHERVRSQLGGIAGRIWLLPFQESLTGETAGMRQAYRTMLKEPSIKAALLDKLLTVASLDTSVTPGEVEETDERLAAIARGRADLGARFGRHLLKKLSGGQYGPVGIRAIVENVILPGLIDGYGIAEKIWDVNETMPFRGKIFLKLLKAKNPDYLQMEVDEFNNITGLVGTRYNAGEIFEPRNFVIWQHVPLFSNPAGMSDLRAAYRAYWLIDTAWKLRAIHLEKYTSPMLKGTYASPDQRASLEGALETARSSTWVSIPEGVLVEALELSQRGTSDFQTAINDLKHECFLGISGAILQSLEGTTTEGRGSSAVHKSTADIRKWHLSQCVCDVVNQQIFPDAIDINYSDMPYPELALGGVDDTELASSLAVDVGLFRDLQLPLSKQDVYARYGRPAPVDGEDTLAPATPAGQPGLPFSETDDFCQVGPNRGKPGPCPEPEGVGEATSQPAGAKKKAAPPGSQMDQGTRDKLRAYGMQGTFPPSDVPMSAVKVADLSRGPEALKYEALMSWEQKTKSGRVSRQYRYTQAFHDRNAAEKFGRVSAIEPHAEKIKDALRSGMTSGTPRQREAAAIASTIMETGLRPTDGAESVKHGHFGIASIQGRHAKVVGDEVHLDFIGKEGIRNQTTIRDPATVAFFKDALGKTKPEESIFKSATSDDAGDLLKATSKAVGGPEDIKVKDLRTLKAFTVARQAVAEFKGPPPPLTGNPKKDAAAISKAILAMSGRVAEVLNNNPTMARDNYIHPEIFKSWQSRLQSAG